MFGLLILLLPGEFCRFAGHNYNVMRPMVKGSDEPRTLLAKVAATANHHVTSGMRMAEQTVHRSDLNAREMQLLNDYVE